MSAGRTRVTAAAATWLLGCGIPLGACSGTSTPASTSPSAATSGVSCANGVGSSVPQAVPPDLPVPTGAAFYQLTPQGSSHAYFAAVAGNDVMAERDRILTQLRSAGYRIVGSDAEPNTEAELEFSGRHEGTVQVIHHTCAGELRVRYVVQR